MFHLGLLVIGFAPSTRLHTSVAALVGPRARPIMGVTLYGSQQTRSPLVNWYCHEAGIDFEMASSPSRHPFGQVPLRPHTAPPV